MYKIIMSEIKEASQFNTKIKMQQLAKLEARLNFPSSLHETSSDTSKPSAPKEQQKIKKTPTASCKGHRARLKQRFLKSGFSGFNDYEIIELILFNALPRCDTKPIAKSLLKKFKTLNNVFSASKDDIKQVDMCGDNVYYTLQLFSQTNLLLSQEQLNQAPLLSKWNELKNYLRLKIAYLNHEEFHVLFLNSKSYLIHDLKIFRGTVDKAAIYPREILKHAIEYGAASMILAHNHPSGDATPSHADIQLTYKIIEAAQLINIHVIDHIIVGKYDIKSFRNLNLL